MIKRDLHIVARNRRRKAQIMRAEFPRYAECVAFVAEELRRRWDSGAL